MTTRTVVPFAIHGPGGTHLIPRNGWYVDVVEIGSDPNDHSGKDYSSLADAGIRVIARVNHSYHGMGTIPFPAQYDNFAKRVANWISASKGVFVLCIGNETNYQVEWPKNHPDEKGEQITPQLYADCYRKVWRAVRAVSPVLMTHAAVAPWNMNAGHWLDYFQSLMSLIGDIIDFIDLHTYTHGTDPNLVYSDAKMDAPNDKLFYHFRAFEDFLARAKNITLPVLITETDQNDPWLNLNSGWVKNAYGHCHWYSSQPGNHDIVCLALYRWAEDKWEFASKDGVQQDFRDAVAFGYTYTISADTAEPEDHTVFIPIVGTGGTMPPSEPIIWDTQLDQRGVKLIEYHPAPGETYTDIIEGQYYDRNEAGGRVNAYFDVVDENGNRITHDESGNPIKVVVVWSGNQSAEVLLEAKPGEPWAGSFIMGSAGGGENYPSSGFAAHVKNYAGDVVQGFALGDIAPGDRFFNIHVAYGFRWQRKQASSVPSTPSTPAPEPELFREGDRVRMIASANVRKSPGHLNKQEGDVMWVLPPGSLVMLMDGPFHTNGFPWWEVAGHGGKILGWISERYGDNLPMFVDDDSNFDLYTPIPRPTPNPSPSEAHLPAYLVSAFSRVLGIEARLANSFIDVESGEQAFGPDGRVLIRFEAGVFDGKLGNPAVFANHFKYSKVQGEHNEQFWRVAPDLPWQKIHTGSQETEYAAFEFAANINREAAFDSISMGLGQVMGFNSGLLSYPSSQAMYQDFGHPQWGYYNQLVGFFAYIQNRQGMLQAVKNRDFLQMSLLYNGSASYEALLRNAYEQQAT